MSYATVEQVANYIGLDDEDLPSNLSNMIERAGELIDYFTLNRSQYAQGKTAEVVAKAVSAQVQYWLEVGEEIAITGSPDSFSIGPMSVDGKLPTLAPRARHLLLLEGLLSKGLRRK